MRSITERTEIFKQLKREKDGIKIWDHFCQISPIDGIIAKNMLIKKYNNTAKLKAINYHSEKFQAFIGIKITNEKFGFSKTYQDKKKLLNFTAGQFELFGMGSFEWIKQDFKNELFIVKMISPYAKTYVENLGLSKDTVDEWNAGAWAGCIEYILNKKVGCIETSCIAQGKKYCEFVIKPLNKWNKQEKIVKENKHIFEDPKLKFKKIRF